MIASDLIHKLILREISLSQGLLLCKVNYKEVLSKESFQWICNELDQYNSFNSLPDYRVIDCTVKVRIRDPFWGTKTEELDLSLFRRLSEDSDKAYAFPNKMLVTQNIEYLENIISLAEPSVIIELQEGQKDILMKYYTLSPNFRIESIYQESRIEPIKNIITSVRNKLISILQEEVLIIPPNFESNTVGSQKTVFISYGWDDDPHCKWVHSLAERLSKYFKVLLDKDIPFGHDLNLFMEQSIPKADRVLLILTPKYKEKADARQRGVGYETVIISNELYYDQYTSKFLPIIRKGSIEESYPLYLGSRKGIDMSDDSLFEDKLKDLVNDIMLN